MNTREQKPGALEIVVVAHLALFVVGTSWAFGGNASWVRVPIAAWGSIGVFLALGIASASFRYGHRIPTAFRWIWPMVLLNAVVALSGIEPGFRTLSFGGEALLMPVRAPWWAPTSASYSTSLQSLWLLDGIYFSCLNLALAVRSRRLVRLLVAIVAGNAAALAVFGTVQKLIGSTGIYFGAIPSPNPAFFASFVYDNHWGAFALLMFGACVGIAIRYAHGIGGWGFLHGPALAGIVCAVLLATSVPLSGSRACTLLLVVQAAYAMARGLPRVIGGLSVAGVKRSLAIGVTAAALVVALLGIWTVVGDAARERAEVTREQILDVVLRGGGVSRQSVYRDTWHMARQRPVYGWGMGSYPTVFPLFNTQVRPNEKLPIVYHDAHSDLLQSFAEIGFLGTLLIAGAVYLPSRPFFRAKIPDLSVSLLSGCLLVALYALVEFPFGNVAVVLSWWLCFMAAVQYARLS